MARIMTSEKNVIKGRRLKKGSAQTVFLHSKACHFACRAYSAGSVKADAWDACTACLRVQHTRCGSSTNADKKKSSYGAEFLMRQQ